MNTLECSQISSDLVLLSKSSKFDFKNCVCLRFIHCHVKFDAPRIKDERSFAWKAILGSSIIRTGYEHHGREGMERKRVEGNSRCFSTATDKYRHFYSSPPSLASAPWPITLRRCLRRRDFILLPPTHQTEKNIFQQFTHFEFLIPASKPCW